MKEILPIERDKMFFKVTFKSLEQAEMLQKTLSENHEKLFEIISESKSEDNIHTIYKIDPSLVRVISDIKNSDKIYKDIMTEIVDGQ